jgi:hypothetical protein
VEAKTKSSGTSGWPVVVAVGWTPTASCRFASTAPPVPASVSADPRALEHWNDLVKRLQASGVLQAGHVGVYTLYAHTAADYDRLRQQFASDNYQT